MKKATDKNIDSHMNNGLKFASSSSPGILVTSSAEIMQRLKRKYSLIDMTANHKVFPEIIQDFSDGVTIREKSMLQKYHAYRVVKVNNPPGKSAKQQTI